MPGPNFVLDKGYVPTAAVRQFRCVTASTTKEKCTEAASAGALVLGIAQEEATAGDATNERVINIRLMGISRAIADAAYSIGTRVRTAADGRVTALAAATANQPQVGVLTTASTAANDHVDVLLTPGVNITVP